MGKTWWNRPLNIIQYNLQIKDTGLMDEKRIAKEVAALDADAVVINVIDSVLWFEPKQPGYTVNPYLPKDRDLLAGLIKAFHEHGIKVIGRVAMIGFEEEVYKQKPQWVRRTADGRPVTFDEERPGDWKPLYQTCPTRRYGDDGLAMELVKEMLSHYPLDGLFLINGTAQSGNCGCLDCRRRYRELFHEDMPEEERLVRPDWNKGIIEQNKMKFKEAVLQLNPDLLYVCYFWPFELHTNAGVAIPADNIDYVSQLGTAICTEAQNVLSKGRHKLEPWHTPALRMKMGRTVKNYPPPIGIIHTCPGMDWRHTCLPQAEFLSWSAQIPANGGTYWTSFTGFGSTILDQRMVKAVGWLNQMTAKASAFMEGAESICDVLLLCGNDSVYGWAEALTGAHIDFDMLAHYQLTYERIRHYPVVVVPCGFAHSENSKQIFADYVKAGGGLIIEEWDAEVLQPLHELLGVQPDIEGRKEQVAAYLRIEAAGEAIKARLDGMELVPLRGRFAACRPDEDTCVLATWVPPFATLATSGLPPERASLPVSHTETPLTMISRRQKGTVMFLPYEAGRLVFEYGMKDMCDMLAACVEMILKKRQRIRVQAPAGVMHTVFGTGDTMMIHLVNGVGQRPLRENIPCSDIVITIPLNGRKVRGVEAKLSECQVGYEIYEDMLVIQSPRLEIWDMLLIEFKEQEGTVYDS